MNLASVAIKPFVPAVSVERSAAFYRAIGFDVPWCGGDLALVRHGTSSFLLQAFNEPSFIQNYMIHFMVEDVDAWHSHLIALKVADEFGVTIGTPEDQPWGLRDFTLTDPSGVLWRIAQEIPRH
ncbi:MAG: hypothetical protein U1F71_03245 [Verrucomicrobiaceae bacterium]